jgi:predicted nucleotidyltransferase
MDREAVLSVLREHADELRSCGVTHLQIFGSVARGDATDGSDVDLLADFDAEKRLSLLGVAGIQVRLEEMLGRSVDLSSPAWLKPRVSERAMREAVVVF